eukprot:2923412-Rhodomonas_salina.1
MHQASSRFSSEAQLQDEPHRRDTGVSLRRAEGRRGGVRATTTRFRGGRREGLALEQSSVRPGASPSPILRGVHVGSEELRDEGRRVRGMHAHRASKGEDADL